MHHQSVERKMVDSEESMIQRAVVAPPRNNPPHKKFLEAQAEKKAWVSQGNNAEASKVTETLLAEIKSAYRQVLQEKEEQVLILKNEISDLRTLVNVLESENKRLRS